MQHEGPSRIGLGGLSRMSPGRSLGIRTGVGGDLRWDLGGGHQGWHVGDHLGWSLEGPPSDWTWGII